MIGKQSKGDKPKQGFLAWLVSLSPVTFRSLIILLSLFFLAWIIAFLLIIFAITYIVDSPSELAQIMLLSLALIVGVATFTTVAWRAHRYYNPVSETSKKDSKLPSSKFALNHPRWYTFLYGLGGFLSLTILVSLLASIINCTLQKKFCNPSGNFEIIPQILSCSIRSVHNIFQEQACAVAQNLAGAPSNSSRKSPDTTGELNILTKAGEVMFGSSYDFANILIFSLALIIASLTFTFTLLRSNQVNEQINKAQEQNSLTRFQNALEMATDKYNAGRAATGFRVLENMHDHANPLDKQVINSVALYVLSISKEILSIRKEISSIRKEILPLRKEEGEEKKKEKEDKEKEQREKESEEKKQPRVSMTVRQWALDILIDRKFLCYENHKKNEEKEDQSMEISIANSTIEKDFSRLNFTRKFKNKNNILNLSEFSFRESDFSGANLSNIDFSKADFSDARLHGTNLSRVILKDIRGLPSEHLTWAYFFDEEITTDSFSLGIASNKYPKIDIKGWNEWVSHVNNKLSKENLKSTETSLKIQDFLINFTLAIREFSLKDENLSFQTSCDQKKWNDFFETYEKPPTYEDSEEFWKFMSPEVWSYLRYLTQGVNIKFRSFADDERKIAEYTMTYPRIKLWDEWKKFIREKEDAPEGINSDVWEYMKQLAEGDADYPPGAAGDDEREEEG